MRESIRKTTPEALVENVLQLITLPEIYLRLQQTSLNLEVHPIDKQILLPQDRFRRFRIP